MYKVQEVAKIAGVSVRTLHHYDSIGLMKPSNIGSNRYRYYNDDDLKLLQHILFFKELGFSLKKIQELVAGGFDPNHALIQHAELLHKKKERIEKLIENAKMTQLENAGTHALSNEERFSAFSIKKTADDISKYAEKVPTAEFAEKFEQAEAQEEAAAVTEIPASDPVEEAKKIVEQPQKEEEDLEEINREGDRIYNTVSSYMHLSPESAEVQKEMKAYYTLLNRFYNCTPKMFRGLGDLYASDSRFANNIDQHGKGLSKYLKEAMHIYAEGMQNA